MFISWMLWVVMHQVCSEASLEGLLTIFDFYHCSICSSGVILEMYISVSTFVLTTTNL
jgi:hypothetical protein